MYTENVNRDTFSPVEELFPVAPVARSSNSRFQHVSINIAIAQAMWKMRQKRARCEAYQVQSTAGISFVLHAQSVPQPRPAPLIQALDNVNATHSLVEVCHTECVTIVSFSHAMLDGCITLI